MQSIKKKNNGYQKNGRERRLPARTPLTILAVALGLGSLLAQAEDIPVSIYFDTYNCPDRVEVPEDTRRIECDSEDKKTVPCVEKQNDKIVWTAYKLNTADEPTDEPMTEGFTIYFDPFKGKSLEAHKPNSSKKSNKIDEDAPLGLYKYTVVGTACPDKPLDPNIIVR